MPTARASSCCVRRLCPFSMFNTSQIGSDPPASASAALNARPTAFEVTASWSPIGVLSGFIMNEVYYSFVC